MLSDRQWCPNEDTLGRRCHFGPNHQGECRFAPFVPSPKQVETLQDIARVQGVRRMQCVGTSTVASLRALSRRGFITMRYVNSRAYDATLTPAGARLLEELPR
jgi:hypothetical protein